MRYTLTHRCGHPTDRHITGRDRAERVAQATADTAAVDCGPCRNRHATYDQLVTTHRRDPDTGITIRVRYHGVQHRTPCPGGGWWVDPGWQVDAQLPDGDPGATETHPLRRDAHGRLVAPDPADVDAAVARVLARTHAMRCALTA